MKQSRFKGVFELRKRKGKSIYTRNLTPGKKYYDESLFKDKGYEYREWNPKKSKLGAAILKGIQEIGINSNQAVLYLGASTGTTVSHVSDIVGKDGIVFAVEFAPRVTRELVFSAEARKNIAPILADANHPESYADKVCQADAIFMDIAQKNQTEIFLKNIDFFLKPGGIALLALKARSVDVTARPKQIFQDVKAELQKHLKLIDFKELAPFELDHCIFVCRKK